MAKQSHNTQDWIIISGEPSSDVYGAQAIAALPPGTRVRGVGGPKMRKLAPELLDQEVLTVSGFTEPLKRLPSILRLRRTIRKMLRSDPKIVLLMDSPGFNMAFLKQLSAYGHYVIYWLPPQTWAWHESRVKSLKKHVHEVWVLYNFELEHFQSHGIKTIQCSHPLLSLPHLQPMTPPKGQTLELMCLPGSRINEIQIQRELFLEACDIIAQQVPISVQLVAHETDRDIWSEWQLPKKSYPIKIRHGLKNIKPVDMAIATSGTVIFECGLMGIPTVVTYKASWINYKIAMLVTHLRLFSLPNIIFKREVLPERIQEQCNPHAIADSILHWWKNPEEYNKVRVDLSELRNQVGVKGLSIPTLIHNVINSTVNAESLN